MDIMPTWKEIFTLLAGITYIAVTEWRRRNETKDVKNTVEAGTQQTKVAAEAAKDKAEIAATKMDEVHNVLNGDGILGILKSLLRQVDVLKDTSSKRLKTHSTDIKEALRRVEAVEKILMGKKKTKIIVSSDSETDLKDTNSQPTPPPQST